MEAIVWLVVCGALAAVAVSLATALVHLSRGGADDSRKLVRALTVRISISLALFALLMIAWYFGLISPHGVQALPPQP